MKRFFKSRSILKNTDVFELTPVARHKYEADSNGIVKILVPKITNERIARFLIPSKVSRFYTIELDEIGSEVWLSIDGVTNIKGICQKMTARFGERIQPVEERVIKFLSGLYHNKHISFTQIAK